MYDSSSNVAVVPIRDRLKSNASQAPNPMYSSISPNQDARRSFNMRRGERVEAIQRSHSSAAAVNRRTRQSRESDTIPPVYTSIVPKGQRKREPSPTQDQTLETQANGEVEGPLYSDIDQINTRGKKPIPLADQGGHLDGQMGLRGKEPSPLVDNMPELRGREPSPMVVDDKIEDPSPAAEQVATEEVDGQQLYSTLDHNGVQKIEPPPLPEWKEGDGELSEPVYSSIHDAPPRSKTASVSLGNGKPVGGAEGTGDQEMPGEEEYATLKHL